MTLSIVVGPGTRPTPETACSTSRRPAFRGGSLAGAIVAGLLLALIA